MKLQSPKLLSFVLTLSGLLASLLPSQAQVLVKVDPSQHWIGYMNVFQLPADGGGYLFGNPWGLADLRGAFSTNQLVLQACTNVWETNDTFYVQADGQTPNRMMDANFYVQDDTLANTNVIFVGSCSSNSLTATPEPLTGVSYTSVAFIKIFDGGYNLIGSATSNLLAGQSFTLTLDTTGATHVQYGFETMGPDVAPGSATAQERVVVPVAGPLSVVTVDPSQNWIGYMNVFALPSNGGGYQFGNPWGTSALQAAFSGTNVLTLSPCTNVWETNDAYWVQADGQTPNKIMDASFYVQNDNLANSNVVFIGTCLDDTLTTSPEPLTGVSYTSKAFIKMFDGSYNLLGSASSPELVGGQAFVISLNTAGAAHVQYGFETVGPDANPATASGLGNVQIAVEIPPSPLQVPTNSAPVPTRPASSVLCLYNSSGTYPLHPVERWLASWSGAAESGYTITGTGRTVLKYSSLQYAGVEFYNNDPTLGAGGDNVGGATNYSVNVTNYDTFHVDLWTPNANQFGIKLVSINPTEDPQVDFLPDSGAITNGGWISLDIPLSTFTAINPSVDWSDLQQLLWIDNQSGGGVTGGIFYIDNVYFYNSTVVVQPTLNARVVAGSMQLSFSTQNGSTYTVQYKNRLADASWQTLTTVSGNGAVQVITDPANASARFYRLYVH